MRILLDTSELKYLYSLLKPLCDYVPFNSAIVRIVSVSLNNFSRSQSSELWELIENCEDEELVHFLTISDTAFIKLFELNIDMFVEHVFKHVERKSGIILDNHNVLDTDVCGNTLFIDIKIQ